LALFTKDTETFFSHTRRHDKGARLRYGNWFVHRMSCTITYRRKCTGILRIALCAEPHNVCKQIAKMT